MTATAPHPPPATPPLRVGVGELAAATGPVRISTYALGSCIGVCIFALPRAAVGLLHARLPSAQGHEDRARFNPATFVDTGMATLLKQLQRLGASPRDMRAILIGGAQMGTGEAVEIGRKNIRAARKSLWHRQIPIQDERTGGTAPRTLHISIPPLRLQIKSPGGHIEEIQA